ncbi:LSM domain protein [Trichinella nativa]|uniref:Small nuclear ribonucleoprotein Sm D3 n=1 Tax=Trichinella nativa TaxID=6335 RepID=A0A1Y3EQM7_9BILA|nr:LSM domain protein [Trichinella nativa]
MSLGVPLKILHEAEGHIVMLETTTGEVFRGKLLEAEDNMNCNMTDVTVTYRDGQVTQMDQVYIRGSKIQRFVTLKEEEAVGYFLAEASVAVQRRVELQ